MSMFGGVESKAKSCELNAYLYDKLPKFFKALVYACSENVITGYGKRGHVTFVEPSAAAMKDIEAALKKNNHEVVTEIARAHILRQPMLKLSDWARFTKSNDKEHLANGNFKRITVQEVKGKNVVLDGGAQVTHVKNLGNVGIWKTVGSGSMPVSGLADIDRAKEPSFDGSKKPVSGGASADGLLLEAVQFGFGRYSEHGLGYFSRKHYELLNILKSNDHKLFCQVLALTTTDGGPSDYLLALHMVCKNNPSVFKKVTDNAKFASYSSGDCGKLVRDCWSDCFQIENWSKLDELVSEQRANMLKAGRCVLVDLVRHVRAMYSDLEKNNCLSSGGSKIYSEHVHEYLRSNPGFKAWADYFRFYCDQSVMECEAYLEGSSRSDERRQECQLLFGSLISRLLVNNYEKETIPINSELIKASVDLNQKFIHVISFVRHGIPFFHRDYAQNVSYSNAKEGGQHGFKISSENLSNHTYVRDYVHGTITAKSGGSERVEKNSCVTLIEGLNTKGDMEQLLLIKEAIEKKLAENSDEPTEDAEE